MHTIKITPNLLFVGKFIRLPNRIEKIDSVAWIESNRNFFGPNWNALQQTNHLAPLDCSCCRNRCCEASTSSPDADGDVCCCCLTSRAGRLALTCTSGCPLQYMNAVVHTRRLIQIARSTDRKQPTKRKVNKTTKLNHRPHKVRSSEADELSCRQQANF